MFSPHWWPSWFLLSRDLKSGRIMRHLMAGVLLQDFASHESSWVIMDWAWFKVFAIFCNLACLHRTSTMQQQPTLGSEKGGKHPGRHQKGSCPTVKPASPIQWRDEILRSPLQDFYCLVQTSSQFSRHVEANLFFGVCDAWMALQRRTWGDVRLPMCNPWCWNIYQHLPHKSPSFVGKYTIHGAYGSWQDMANEKAMSRFEVDCHISLISYGWKCAFFDDEIAELMCPVSIDSSNAHFGGQ